MPTSLRLHTIGGNVQRWAGTARAALRGCLEALLVALILALFVRTFLFQVLEVPSDSMEPGLLAGDRLLIDKTIFARHDSLAGILPARSVRPGELVLFRFPEDPSRSFVKRCLGMPGDEIEIINKVLYIDGEIQDESGYVVHRDPRTYVDSQFLDQEFRLRDHLARQRVPAEHMFCLGDNRDVSNDSRYWGPVPLSSVLGRPLLVLWSLERNVPARDGLSDADWGKIQVSWFNVGKGVRWNRSLKRVQ